MIFSVCNMGLSHGLLQAHLQSQHDRITRTRQDICIGKMGETDREDHMIYGKEGRGGGSDHGLPDLLPQGVLNTFGGQWKGARGGP